MIYWKFYFGFSLSWDKWWHDTISTTNINWKNHSNDVMSLLNKWQGLETKFLIYKKLIITKKFIRTQNKNKIYCICIMKIKMYVCVIENCKVSLAQAKVVW